MTVKKKPVGKKKSKLVAMKKKKAVAPKKSVVAKKKATTKRSPTAKSVTSEPTTKELRERLAQDEQSIRESQEPQLVKCRFCDAMIVKPEGTVYECEEHVNFTGDAKFNSLGQRTMV